MSKATERALEEAIEAHILSERGEAEEEDDRHPGVLTAWVVMTECVLPSQGAEGETMYRVGYWCGRHASPAATVGVARLGLMELERDMTPE